MVPELHPLGRILILSGLVLLAIGLFVLYGPKVPWFGRLPGDILIRRDNSTFYFPLTTCILISLLLSLVLWLAGKRH